ncbi:DUF58 domain-containing protein [Halothiobacillus neapolitanus]|uniref:Uncharacterized protein n=1 Tax=Halothiobacillus neapolitanus (strain ATCC 23641 / DSM 15147 / CIP 104769 / NCIMB 8539 / c2) TaxID=555778 RepID=D0KYQ3_HALNC|nr:DUF58 domain-containing protein [Halothiobacillus neapolitanus]ACX95576.1 protein of unknown function DUF58 [Halothiobacillus neapolitanus c2]TDN65879.1 uncharacterized protein (DUF58 family) [Halothiobacillus neapolitanus]
MASTAKIRLRPNKIGFGFIALSIAMLLAAINYGNNLVFFISFLLLALMGNSAWQTRRHLKSCQIQLLNPPARFDGEIGMLPVQIESSINNPSILARAGEAEPLTLNLSAGRTELVELALRPMPRGRYAAPDVILSTRYPIGLWTAETRWVSLPHWQWIYPKPVGEAPLPTNLLPAHAEDPDVSLQSGDDQFDHLRAYVSGDALSRIAFKHYARSGQMVTQHWQSSEAIHDEIILDYSQLSGSTEMRLQQLTRWILSLAADHRSFTLKLPGIADRQGADSTHVTHCLEALTLFSPAHNPRHPS